MRSFLQLWTKSKRSPVVALVIVSAFLSISGCKKSEQAREKIPSGPAVFATPDSAATAIFEAAKSGDLNHVYAIFGEETRDYLVPGDAAAAVESLHKFAGDYQQMHRWSKLNNGGLTLEVGVENYSFPFPLLKSPSGQWSFDTGAGRKEILARRIGDNELYTLQVLETMAAAQTEYFAEPRDGSKVRQYAQKFWSDAGKHNGLYWKAAENEPESPLGPLAAQASAEQHPGETVPATPFHGYFYRILVKQGDHAKGGAKEYIVNGNMTRGFSFLAYPAEYRKSGVMTFLVNQDGVTYQCDLGDNTGELAQRLDAFNPDETWQPVQ